MSAKKQSPVEPTVAGTAALNRKYRPQSFHSDELVGQDHVVRTLRNAIRMDRVAQAYLFCGPRGTGKTSTARILAKAVNCIDPDPDKRPCNRCAACESINNGSSPDVIEIDAASNRGIDDIRDLRERVNYAPTQLRTKFYIIDEAHQITGAAANAFLKTLEEPPVHTRFVLATTDPEELLPTIVSRCQRFDFRRHTRDGIVQRIKTLAEREGISLADDAVLLIADLAHGSMRDPVGLLEQLANYQSEAGGNAPIDAAAVRELVGISRSELAIQIVSGIANRDAQVALGAVNDAIEAGQDVRHLNRQVAGLIRNALQVASGLRVAEYAEELGEVARLRPLPELIQIAATFVDTDAQIRSASIPQLPLELAILQSIVAKGKAASPSQESVPTIADAPQPIKRAPVTAAPDTSTPRPSPVDGPVPPFEAGQGNGAGTLASMARRPSEQRPSPLPTPEPSPIPVAPKIAEPQQNPIDAPVSGGATGPLTLESLMEMWNAVRADVKSLDRRIEALLLEIDPVDITGQRVTLVSQYDFHRNMLNEPARRSIIESVINRRTGQVYRVEVVLRTEFEATVTPSVTTATPSSTDADRIVAEEPASATDISAEDGEKFLGAVVRIFDGEIVNETDD